MVRSYYKIWVQTEDSSVRICCRIDLCYTVVLTSSSSSATKSLFFIIPQKKSKLSFPVGLSVCPLSCSLGCPKSFISFPFSFFRHWLLWKPTYPSGLQPSAHPWLFLGFCWYSSATAPQSSLSAWLPQEPSFLCGLSPGGPPWLWFNFPFEIPLCFHFNDEFCLFCVVYCFILWAIVSLLLLLSEILIIVFLILFIYPRFFYPENSL